MQVGFGFWLEFARDAGDWLGWIDCVENSAHWQTFVDELGDELLSANWSFWQGAVMGFPDDQIKTGGGLTTVFVAVCEHGRSGGCLSEMCRMVAGGDVGASNAEGNITRRDHDVDDFCRVEVSVEGSCSVCIRMDVQGFNAREFMPSAYLVLVSFNVCPDNRERESPGNCNDLVCNVVFRAESSAYKDGLHGEFSRDVFDKTLVICGNTDLGFGCLWQHRSRVWIW